MVSGREWGVCADGNFRAIERSDDLTTAVLIVIILIDLGLPAFGVRGRVH
jgi:hypothetical protein